MTKKLDDTQEIVNFRQHMLNREADYYRARKKEKIDVAEAARIRHLKKSKDWITFLDQVQNADELWSYCSSAEELENLCGSAGYVILRGEKIVDVYTTAMT